VPNAGAYMDIMGILTAFALQYVNMSLPSNLVYHFHADQTPSVRKEMGLGLVSVIQDILVILTLGVNQNVLQTKTVKLQKLVLKTNA